VCHEQAMQDKQLREKLKALRTQILWIDKYSKSSQETIQNQIKKLRIKMWLLIGQFQYNFPLDKLIAVVQLHESIGRFP
jgi:hypothetical protein